MQPLRTGRALKAFELKTGWSYLSFLSFLVSCFITSLELSPASASTMEASATPAMEPSTAEAPSVEAPKTGLSSEGIGSGDPTMIEPAEGAGTHSSVGGAPAKAAATRIGGMVEAPSRRIETIAIDDGPAM